jgi:AcrR family transcriptional regulator
VSPKAQPIKRDKEGKYVRVAESVAALLPQRGVRGLSIAAVASSAGISRRWIYRYVGKSQKELLEPAARHFVTVFTGMTDPGQDETGNREAWWHGGAGRIFQHARKNPEALRLYFQFAGASHELGRMLGPVLEMHRQHQALELQKEHQLTAAQAEQVGLIWDAFRLGMAFESAVAREPQQNQAAERYVSDPRLSRALFSALLAWAKESV